MAREITIDPVTRIEGHAKITLHLDDKGEVSNAFFHVTQFRGFEKFCEGRPFHEMPSITARTCGICPVSHLLAGAKAGDALMAVRIPPTASKLRKLLNLGQILQSHALSFFHLSAPDLVLGWDADPADRNVLGLIKSHPEAAKHGVRLRQIGQRIIERLAGERIHPAWVVAGGVNNPLSEKAREDILADLPEAMDLTKGALELLKSLIDKHAAEIDAFANFPTKFMGLVGPEGELEHYDGKLRIVDENRKKVVEDFDPSNYAEYIGEAVEKFSYLKSPYYKPDGYPDGIYRVGPLARLNAADKCGTPVADAAHKEFRALGEGTVQSSFHYHFARLVEMLYCVEKAGEILDDPDILSKNVRAFASPNSPEGVGVTEAPRGSLIHHYKSDENGLITWVNMIVATGHNNLAMNRGVLQVAKAFVKGEKIQEGMLNRVEAVIRAFDPCLSCSTHAVGQMPLAISLVSPEGKKLDEARR